MSPMVIALQFLRSVLRRILPPFAVRLLVKLFQAKRTPYSPHFIEERSRVSPSGDQRDFLKSMEGRVYSQNGEDGLTVYLLSRVASHGKRFVEVGVEDGRECNSAILSLHLGWKGILVEADTEMANSAEQYYSREAPGRVAVMAKPALPATFDSELKQRGYSEDVDLLSIDIDSFDYYLWDSLKILKPALVIMEYNATFGPSRSVTVPIEAGFSRYNKHYSGYYWGASLKALEKLGSSKGYVLVCVESNGTNAFFIRQDLLSKTGLKALSSEEAYYPLRAGKRRESPEIAFERIKHLPLIQV